MAIELNYTDSFGENYPQSYWKPVQVNFSEADKNGQIVFYGYRNAVQKGKRIVGQKLYPVSLTQIDSYFKISPPDTSTTRNALLSTSYKLAKETLDVDTGARDANGNAIMRSFFQGGLDV